MCLLCTHSEIVLFLFQPRLLQRPGPQPRWPRPLNRRTFMTKHAREKTRIGTWKVRTLNIAVVLAQVAEKLGNHKLDIRGLQEVRWTYSSEHRLSTGQTLLYSCRPKTAVRGSWWADTPEQRPRERSNNDLTNLNHPRKWTYSLVYYTWSNKSILEIVKCN